MSAALLHRASAASVAGLRTSSAPRRTAAASTTTSTSTAAAAAPRAALALALGLAAASAAAERERRRRPSAAAGFFKFGKNGMGSADAGIYAAQGSRDDYCLDDVEHYFNYMGMLADEGSYDRMERMLSGGAAPVDVILLMAAAENDLPKVEELLAAGADVGVRDEQGRSPRDLATKPEVVAMLEAAKPVANKA